MTRKFFALALFGLLAVGLWGQLITTTVVVSSPRLVTDNLVARYQFDNGSADTLSEYISSNDCNAREHRRHGRQRS